MNQPFRILRQYLQGESASFHVLSRSLLTNHPRVRLIQRVKKPQTNERITRF
jgi:hypothetical protein